MMTEGKHQHSEMAQARLSEGISVIFDQDTPSSSASPPISNSSSSSSSGTSRRPRARDSHRRRTHRSSSSSSGSSNSRSRSRPRSRSHPRCHRPSSRCGCNSHRRHGHGQRRSPPRHARAHSSSSSPSPDRSSRRRGHSSKSNSQRGSYRSVVGRYRRASPHRSSRTHRSRSPSRSSRCSAINLTLDEKRELLRVAKNNATKILGVAHLELPESVKPIPEERPVDSRLATPEPEEWVRRVPAPEKTQSQNSESESEEDGPSPKMSPTRKGISFSIHNSIAKPTVVAPSSAKVTSRVDSVGSRKPYGHWVPVGRTGHTSQSRKHRLTTSH